MTRLFVGSFVLTVLLSGDPAMRRVVKLSYSDRINLETDRRWGEAVWLADASRALTCESYHFEVKAPDELEVIAMGTFDRADNLYTRFLPAQRPGRAGVVFEKREQAFRRPCVDVAFRTPRAGTLNAALASSLLTFAATASICIAAWFGVLDDLAREPLVTLLIAVCGLPGLYLARPREHPEVTKVVRGIRRRLVLSSGCGLLGAFLLAIGNEAPMLWLALTVVALFVFLNVLRGLWRLDRSLRNGS